MCCLLFGDLSAVAYPSWPTGTPHRVSGSPSGSPPGRPSEPPRAVGVEQYSAAVTTPDQLSVEQKVELCAGADTWHTAAFDDPRVPSIRVSDGPAGVRGTSWTGPSSASFPCGTALGATWDPALIGEVGRALGREAHCEGCTDVILAPTVNLHRTPIGGRNFEC